MRPVKPAGANHTWQLPGAGPCATCGGSGSEECPGCWGSGWLGDLPVRLAGGPREESTSTSAWRPDDGERRALANGAAIELSVWGHHPPVALGVGEPPALGPDRLFTASHVEEALGWLTGELQARTERGDDVWGMEDEELVALWEHALRECAPPGTTVTGDGS